jgi:type III secretion protein T
MAVGYDPSSNIISALALTLPRIGAAFLVLPILSNEDMPALVRNSFFVSLAIVAFPYAAESIPESIPTLMWPLLIVKEMFIGLSIGFLFGIVFWAIGNAGSIMDIKAGTTIASIVDPIGGHETSLTGAFLSRFAAWLFMASGGFRVFLDILFGSYTLWPAASAFPQLSRAGELFFISRFDNLMVLSLLLAAPALIILSLVDLGFGLINRYAQQLNVFALSLSIKAWISTWILVLSLGVILQFALDKIEGARGLLNVLKRVL